MSKSVLVIDTPEICVECQFCECATSHCRLNGHEVKKFREKPDWCLLRLLKPLPEKMTGVVLTEHWNGIKAG